MYFNVDDGYIKDGTNSVTVTSHTWTRDRDTWELQYDSVSGGATKSAGVVTKGNTGEWLKQDFCLPDARFANRGAGGTDFRLYSRADGDETVHFVLVESSARPPADPAADRHPHPRARRPAGRPRARPRPGRPRHQR